MSSRRRQLQHKVWAPLPEYQPRRSYSTYLTLYLLFAPLLIVLAIIYLLTR
jgi:hypothetical protein